MPDESEKQLHIAPTVVDMFCGAGGLARGFERAGFRVTAGTDHDPDAMATFAANFPNAHAITGDLRKPKVRAQLVDVARGADVVVGGPPCQAFSQVRNHSRLIDDPRNSLYREFVRVVDRLRPRIFVMENVQGMAQMGVKEQVMQDLSLRGRYRVSAKVLDAADFGVPQTRKRLIFIGVHRDLGVEPPLVGGSGASVALALMADSVAKRGYRLGLRNDAVAEELLDRLRDPSDLGITSVEQAIGDLQFLEAGNKIDSVAVSTLVSPGSAYQRVVRNIDTLENLSVPRMNPDTTMRLHGIPPGGNYRDLPEELLARYLTGQKWGPSTGSDNLARKHYSAYRRLHPDLWAWTLNTKADAVYHFSRPRALSVREFCRLQSFDDAFVVRTDSRRGEIPGRLPNGSTHSKYRQIGNAVPVLLAQQIAARLLEVLGAPKGVAV
ncbi:DNA cytosine methyltransferase [Nocardioides lentus]|uniref:Cytosine-specific methyltransferase n=1 Tax=Nocardioides lentus TaxID=338077 RepID=A0ABP5AME9_9ACTN